MRAVRTCRADKVPASALASKPRAHIVVVEYHPWTVPFIQGDNNSATNRYMTLSTMVWEVGQAALLLLRVVLGWYCPSVVPLCLKSDNSPITTLSSMSLSVF